MTDENLDLMIFTLSTPCWDLSDKTRLEFLDMARELKGRRDEEKEYAVTSTPPSDKNPAGAICEPLKELLAAREKLKSLPEPCTAFKNNSFYDWLGKINEEVGEVIEAMYDLKAAKNVEIVLPDTIRKIQEKRNNLLRELVDVSTVIRSAEYAAGFIDTEINQMQRWVNRHNRGRGYMDEPKKQTDSHEKGKD